MKKVRKGVGKNIKLDETLYTPLLSLELMSVYFVSYFYRHCVNGPAIGFQKTKIYVINYLKKRIIHNKLLDKGRLINHKYTQTTERKRR